MNESPFKKHTDSFRYDRYYKILKVKLDFCAHHISWNESWHRSIFSRVWGVNCGSLTNFDNWRMMYLGRPRLNFNGCYISKTTYIRHGENSFQDQFYRPWHVVEYYRYLRFFPEGTVLMLTTPDQPVPVLNLLKKREARSPSILSGHYRLRDDKVTIVLHRQDLLNNNRYRGRRSNIPNDLVEQTFHIVSFIAHIFSFNTHLFIQNWNENFSGVAGNYIEKQVE